MIYVYIPVDIQSKDQSSLEFMTFDCDIASQVQSIIFDSPPQIKFLEFIIASTCYYNEK